MDLLKRLIAAEQELAGAEKEKREAIYAHDLRIADAEAVLVDAQAALDAYMRENGLTRDVIEGGTVDYVIEWSKPRESIKVLDADAVPDELCSFVRKPRLKDVGEWLRAQSVQPNWAVVEKGQPRAVWKTVKKGSK